MFPLLMCATSLQVYDVTRQVMWWLRTWTHEQQVTQYTQKQKHIVLLNYVYYISIDVPQVIWITKVTQCCLRQAEGKQLVPLWKLAFCMSREGSPTASTKQRKATNKTCCSVILVNACAVTSDASRAWCAEKVRERIAEKKQNDGTYSWILMEKILELLSEVTSGAFQWSVSVEHFSGAFVFVDGRWYHYDSSKPTVAGIFPLFFSHLLILLCHRGGERGWDPSFLPIWLPVIGQLLLPLRRCMKDDGREREWKLWVSPSLSLEGTSSRCQVQHKRKRRGGEARLIVFNPPKYLTWTTELGVAGMTRLF